MDDLRRQLREYLQGTDPISTEEIPGAIGPLPSTGRRRPAVVALGAGAAALLLLGIPSLLLLAGDDPEPGPVSPGVVAPPATDPPATAPTTAPAPASTIPPAINPTTTVPAAPAPEIPGVFLGGWVEAGRIDGMVPALLMALDDRVLLLGEAGSTGEAYSSEDGLSWERLGPVVTVEDGVESPSPALPREFEGIVSIGSRLIGLHAVRLPSGPGWAEIWVGDLTETGISWAETARFEGACCHMDLAANGSTVVALAEGADGGPGVWTSSDGLEWDHVPPETIPGGDPDHGLSFVAPVGPGFLARPFTGTGIYLSVDGREWHADKRSFVAGRPDWPTGSQAALLSAPGRSELCRSPDGATWACELWMVSAAGVSTLDDDVDWDSFRGETPVTALRSLPGGHVAVARRYIGLSADAEAWAWIPATDLLGVEQVEGLQVWNDRLVLAGTVGDATIVWLREAGPTP
jgi:hypothetical protein